MGAAGRQGAALISASAPVAGAYRTEGLSRAGLDTHLVQWHALCAEALEGNIFLEPSFLGPLLARGKAARRWTLLAVWQGDAAQGCGRLVGLLPVRIPRFWGASAVGLRDAMVTCGTPLLHRDCAAAAFAAMLDWIAARPSHPSALTLSGIAADGAFAQMLASEVARPAAVVSEARRAVLRRAGGNVLSLASAKTRKERKRQRRRLSEQGERSYVSACAPEAVARATERFLLLERKGWKGARGTALLADDRLAAFTRAMTAAMAAEGKCRIDALEMDGQAIAMGIVLTSRGQAHFWKTAFDEDLAALSPGVQFAIDLAERQLRDDDVALTDSCAVPDHPMIDRLWPDRLRIVDLAVAVGPRRGFALAVAAGRLRRRLEALLKRRAKALLGRKR